MTLRAEAGQVAARHAALGCRQQPGVAAMLVAYQPSTLTPNISSILSADKKC
jgi:hypothetical protein